MPKNNQVKEKKAIKLRTIFMGTSEFAETILNQLIKEKYNIISVFTKPDKKQGRNKELNISPVKNIAQKNKLPIKQPEKLNKQTIEEIRSLKPDLIIVAAYGKILPHEILEIPGFGAINIHASLLPKYRGPSPIQNAIINGEKETGVTIMLMDKGIDTGKILSQKKVPIEKNEFTSELSKKLSNEGGKLLVKTIPDWIKSDITPQEQNDNNATLCQIIEKEDGHILWNNTAENIYNKYRALTPWPGIFTFWETDNFIKRLKLNKIDFSKKNTENKKLGEIFQENNKFKIQTASGTIILKEVQLEGKKVVPIEEFINGQQDFLDSILK